MEAGAIEDPRADVDGLVSGIVAAAGVGPGEGAEHKPKNSPRAATVRTAPAATARRRDRLGVTDGVVVTEIESCMADGSGSA